MTATLTAAQRAILDRLFDGEKMLFLALAVSGKVKCVGGDGKPIAAQAIDALHAKGLVRVDEANGHLQPTLQAFEAYRPAHPQAQRLRFEAAVVRHARRFGIEAEAYLLVRFAQSILADPVLQAMPTPSTASLIDEALAG